jgi:uncharacterized lipoprotein YddW (UPF0748 family)
MIRIIAIIACVILLTGQTLQAGFAPLVDPAGQQPWQAGPGTPDIVKTPQGVNFPCVFNAKTSRVYWDCQMSADLSKYLTLELELTCPSPEAVQSVALYLKSGKGWYLWIKPLVKSGRQRFFLQIKDAATEGIPAGWHKISGVRLSFQNSQPANSVITLHHLGAGNSGIILVKGTSLSAPDNTERKVADKATDRLSKWLGESGVPHSVLDDNDIAAGRVRSAAIIILPYNPHLADREIRQLEKLSKSGSKLIVFYGTEPRLANLLDMQPGKYQAAALPGQWSSFVFNRSAPAGMPPRIIQDSGNIYTIFPKSEKSKIIAFWQDADGKTLSDPAWIISGKGAWMTHILMGEDSENKKKMLVALLGYFEKGVWADAAQTTAWQSECHTRLSGTGKLPAGEFRGVWNHSGLGLYPGNWPKTCRLLAQAKITAVFPNTIWAGAAAYNSAYVSQTDQSKQFGDQMAQCVAAAHAAGLEVHAWKVCWNLVWAGKDFIESMRKQGRLQKNSRGETVNWLCPSDPVNIALELNMIREVVSRYGPDGIHLDYIRYPDDKTCFCAGCRQRYESWCGQKTGRWPNDVISGRKADDYKKWRRSQITGFVRAVRDEIIKIKPQVKLSAAVYPKYPECAESIGQDWPAWIREGLVDFVCPMDYFPNLSSFREAISSQRQQGGKRVYAGLGVTLDEGDLPPQVFLEQLRILRENGSSGFMLFDLNASLAANYLPLLEK